MATFEPGEKLRLVRLDDWFENNLEQEAVARLKRRIGKQVKFVADGEHGFVEVEFTANEKGKKTIVTIWVEPSCLERIQK